MKIKNGFAKRNIAGSEIVVPVGRTAFDFNGMITLNDSGSFFWDSMVNDTTFFWDCLQKDITKDEMLKMVLDEYEVDAATAKKDIDKFIDMLRENNLLEE